MKMLMLEAEHLYFLGMLCGIYIHQGEEMCVCGGGGERGAEEGG